MYAVKGGSVSLIISRISKTHVKSETEHDVKPTLSKLFKRIRVNLSLSDIWRNSPIDVSDIWRNFPIDVD
ncbi:9803_t:CDS:2, partial [Funneliformis caledonium]